MSLDRPFDDSRVQTANVAMRASTASVNIIDDLILTCSGENDVNISYISDIDETAETDVSEWRGRRGTAELHTSGAKRAETW